MAKRRFRLSTQEANELLAAYQGSKDGPTRTRYQAVRLYGLGYAVTEVMAITNCSRSSLMGWCRQYRTQGGSTLLDKRAGGNSAKLRRAQVQELKERLHQYTPRQLFTTPATPDGRFWTVPDLARAVEHWYGIVYQSYTSYHTLFARCGFSYQRVERVFKSRRAAQVMEFQEQLEKNC